ncbi:uncharacterized protein LOC130933530 [Arachis stenosperma]|uniref:uncharacterized protein LOC130933530 n=1 Tax=Arachis stenosperma TaxID=217475 RepID=UPI0025AD0788|nr:uncharacterized protein LOC130933530 [Arachis stenosperma]
MRLRRRRRLELYRRHYHTPSCLWSQLEPSPSSHFVAVVVVIAAARGRTGGYRYVEEGGAAMPSLSNCRRWSSPLRLLDPLPTCFACYPCFALLGVEPYLSPIHQSMWCCCGSHCQRRETAATTILLCPSSSMSGRSPELLMLHLLISFVRIEVVATIPVQILCSFIPSTSTFFTFYLGTLDLVSSIP